MLETTEIRSKTKNRIKWIDISRGIAIVCVIIGHSLGNYWPNYLANIIFQFHMPIFFVLSGYLYHQKSSKKLLKANLLNLIAPYVAVVFIEIIIVIVCKFFPNMILYSRFGGLKKLVLAGIYGVGGGVVSPIKNSIPWIGAIWFLLAMFFGSLLFNYIMGLKFRENDLLYKGLICLLFALIGTVEAHYFTLPFSINAALLAQIFFFTGYLVKYYNLLDQITFPILIILIAIWLLGAWTGMFIMSMATSTNVTLANVIAGCVSSVAVMKISMILDNLFNIKFKFLKKMFVFWGSQSLIILCFHLIDLDSVQIWPQVVQRLDTIFPYSVAIFGGILYRILFASMFAFIMPKLPVLRNCFMHRNFPWRK